MWTVPDKGELAPPYKLGEPGANGSSQETGSWVRRAVSMDS